MCVFILYKIILPLQNNDYIYIYICLFHVSRRTSQSVI